MTWHRAISGSLVSFRIDLVRMFWIVFEGFRTNDSDEFHFFVNRDDKHLKQQILQSIFFEN